MSDKFTTSLKKAVATFVFATTGVLVGTPIFDIDVSLWKLAAGTGLGAILNLLYRWSESVINGRKGY